MKFFWNVSSNMWNSFTQANKDVNFFEVMWGTSVISYVIPFQEEPSEYIIEKVMSMKKNDKGADTYFVKYKNKWVFLLFSGIESCS